MFEIFTRKGCPWDERTCSEAARGHLECLKYAHENGCPWDEETCSDAARRGHLECLKYLHEKGCPWDERTCSELPKRSPRVFEICTRKWMSLGRRTCSYAARRGHLECLKYAHEKDVLGTKRLVLMLPERSPRVFEICTRKGMSLGRKDLF